MIEINLIPDVKQELLRAQRTRTAVISGSIVISMAAAGIVVVLMLYVFGVQSVRSAILDGEIKTGADKLSQVQDLSKILTIQNQLSKISQLTSEKNMDSRLFDVLSGVIPPAPNDVQISQTSIDATAQTIRIEGQTHGYDSMEVFKKTLDNAIISYTENGDNTQQTADLASEISVTDTSYGTNADNQKVLRFVLTFKYADQLFSPAVDNVTIKLSVDGNVTDSYLGIPKSIFTEKAKDL